MGAAGRTKGFKVPEGGALPWHSVTVLDGMLQIASLYNICVIISSILIGQTAVDGGLAAAETKTASGGGNLKGAFSSFPSLGKYSAEADIVADLALFADLVAALVALVLDRNGHIWDFKVTRYRISRNLPRLILHTIAILPLAGRTVFSGASGGGGGAAAAAAAAASTLVVAGGGGVAVGSMARVRMRLLRLLALPHSLGLWRRTFSMPISDAANRMISSFLAYVILLLGVHSTFSLLVLPLPWPYSLIPLSAIIYAVVAILVATGCYLCPQTLAGRQSNTKESHADPANAFAASAPTTTTTTTSNNGDGGEGKERLNKQHQSLDHICKQMIVQNHILRDVVQSHPDLLNEILSVLRHERFPPGSTLTCLGEIGHHMFFLAKGQVKGVTSNGAGFTLHAGVSFGEIALMLPQARRTATLTALTPCEIFLLDRVSFDILRSRYVMLAKKVREEVGNYLTMDSAHYVGICMREALHFCYAVAFSFLGLIFLLVLAVM